VRGAFRGKLAGEESETVDAEEAEVVVRVAAEEGLERLLRKIAGAGDGDVWVKWLQVGLESGFEDSVLDVFVEGEKVRVALADTGPDDGGAAARVEGAEALEREKEGWDADVREVVLERVDRIGGDVTEEAHGEVQLFRGQPAEAAEVGVESGEDCGAFRRQGEADEEALGGHGLAWR
jgi:hypothetical protein